MTNTAALTSRQASARLTNLLKRSGVKAKVTVMHGRDGSAYFIQGDRVGAAELFNELGIPAPATEYTLYVTHEDIEGVLR